MCIFCGGFCAVDMALPSVAAGASLVFFKVKAVQASRKASKTEEEKPDNEDEAGGGEE